MKLPLIRQGEGPHAALERIQAERDRIDQQLSRIHADPDLPDDTRRFRHTAGGDARKLRGIPVIGGNIGGTTPGSSPHVDGVNNAHRDAENRRRSLTPSDTPGTITTEQ